MRREYSGIEAREHSMHGQGQVFAMASRCAVRGGSRRNGTDQELFSIIHSTEFQFYLIHLSSPIQ